MVCKLQHKASDSRRVCWHRHVDLGRTNVSDGTKIMFLIGRKFHVISCLQMITIEHFHLRAHSFLKTASKFCFLFAILTHAILFCEFELCEGRVADIRS